MALIWYYYIMNLSNNTLKIHDIKPIVAIPDYSIYIFYGLIVLGVVVVGLVLYFIYQYFHNKKNLDQKKYLNILKNIDFENQKQTDYTISKYGRVLAKEDRQIRLFEELNYSLEPFKYKKDIQEKIPQTIRLKYETFLESLDV